MISFVSWKWGSVYTAEHVNVLASMVARWYPSPHTFSCVTNDPNGIDERVTIIPDAEDFADLPSPHGRGAVSCYRRLRLFAPDAAATLGERIVSLDLDCVITGSLTALVDRPAAFVGWSDPLRPAQYCGSMLMLSAGARPRVWTEFDPASSPATARGTRCMGSDQGWISHCLGPSEVRWTRGDGVYSYRWDHVRELGLPRNARIVFFTGQPKPWKESASVPWVRQHWR